MQRAARFLYLQKTAFGGKVAGRSFGVSMSTGARFDVTKLQPVLEAIHDRLAAVTIERLPWADFVRSWDREQTLFYLDPPYFGSEGDYGKELFERREFELMAELLGKIRGKFILSINDTPEIRDMFAHFRIQEAQVRYTIGGGDKAKSFPELIISSP
jgi:DNA adenine methylase